MRLDGRMSTNKSRSTSANALQVIQQILTFSIAMLIGVLWLLPFMGVFMASIRPYDEIVGGWWNFGQLNLTLENFAKAWNHQTAPIGNGLLNSIYIAVPSTMLTIGAASLAGYAFARFKFPLQSWLFFVIILVMAMPAQSIIIPLFFYFVTIGLVDTQLGLILVHTAWGTPWALLFLRNFFLSVPLDVEESARVDGASDLTIFRRIVFPIARPAIISIAVLQFIWVWNDFFFALVLLPSPDKWVVTQMVPLIKGRYFVDWSLVSAASVLSMLPPLLIFVLLQKYYVRGVLAGAIKG